MRDIYLYITQRIHPGSILAAVALDFVWSLFESGSSVVGFLLMPFLIVTIFAVSFTAVTFIQRLGSGDEWPAAMSKGVALGIFAAVPFSVIGIVGAGALGLMRLAYGADEETILLGKLTRSWREIEQQLRRLAPREVRNGSLDEVINFLYSQRLLSKELKDRLHELRKQRNINTHEISTDELARLVDDVQAMEITLQTRFLNM